MNLLQQFKNLKLEDKINDILVEKAKSLLPEMINVLTFALRYTRDVTSNLRTSFAVGVFLNGKLVAYDQSLSEAERQMLKAGETYGTFTAKVGNEGGYARDRALKILKSFTPKQTKGISFVCVSGATYSSYLEAINGYDVMSGFVDYCKGSGVEVFFESVPW